MLGMWRQKNDSENKYTYWNKVYIIFDQAVFLPLKDLVIVNTSIWDKENVFNCRSIEFKASKLCFKKKVNPEEDEKYHNWEYLTSDGEKSP